MEAFPSNALCGDTKLTDVDRESYGGGDKNGYILYKHDRIADGTTDNLTNYVARKLTEYWYWVDAAGTVSQKDTPPPTP